MNEYFDIHSHILPGLDDGAKNIEDSKQMLYTAYNNGIRHIIATPHFHEERFTSTLEEIRTSYEQVKRLIIDLGLDINLYLGQEIYYSSNTPSLLLEHKILTMADSDYVLLEFSTKATFQYIKSALQTIIMSGYIPILAHFERYDDIVSDWNHIDEIFDMGIYIQVNASTITGSIRHKPTRLVRKLLKYDMVHFMATDTHNNGTRPPNLQECINYLDKKYGQAHVDRLLHTNPSKIINNEEI